MNLNEILYLYHGFVVIYSDMAFDDILYIALYLLTIVYLTGLGGFSILRPSEMGKTPIEKKRSRHISNAVGVYMLAFAIECFVYLPPILLYGYENSGFFAYNLCMMLTITLAVPSTLYAMNALLQRHTKVTRALMLTVVPELCILAFYLIFHSTLACHAMLVLSVVSYIYLFAYFSINYKRFVLLLKMEYADLENRDLRWAWLAFCGFSIQGIMYAIHEVWFSAILEYIYMAFSWINCSVLMYFSRKILPIGLPEQEIEEMQTAVENVTSIQDTKDERMALIEEKLQRHCVNSQLYLDSELTRDKLCLAIGINRNHLSLYFQFRNTTYYNYINNLRVQHACQLMEQSNGTLELQQIARTSGFQNLTTFRNAFRERYGCLPSAYLKSPQ